MIFQEDVNVHACLNTVDNLILTLSSISTVIVRSRGHKNIYVRILPSFQTQKIFWIFYMYVLCQKSCGYRAVTIQNMQIIINKEVFEFCRNCGFLVTLKFWDVLNRKSSTRHKTSGAGVILNFMLLWTNNANHKFQN